ncbi:PKD domain-containing protein [Micromonospora viridifaciens]|uniref:PKD domain-containing protein n=1 Tax=Micromonospora viridifaciens TaxID=1881 RepID=UPI0012FD4FBE|nr:PKD domain-containing protein [Micromonospora viridifaciens]
MIALLVAGPTAAYAAPGNDDFTVATVIGEIPYSTTVDTSGATSDPTDPTGCANNGSVWFRYTPTSNTRLRVDTFGSDYDTVLSAWSGEQGSLTQLGCNDDTNGTQSQISFTGTAGTTYYFMVGICCGDGSAGGGSLRFTIDEFQTAANDSFANALPVGALPYSNLQDLATATTEDGEPSSCFTAPHTVWYSYTPTTSGSVMASTNPTDPGIAIYTGSSLSSLSEVACRRQFTYSPVTFQVQAGTTYLFRVGANRASKVTFWLQYPPGPTVDFSFNERAPNSFDTVYFWASAKDPAGKEIDSYTWDFGDGTTSTTAYASHRFTSDGDYTVQLTARTVDGRAATASRVIAVRTHDVSIVRMTVPSTTRVGQTVGVTVNVQNTRYEETVEVRLHRSGPSGYQYLGEVTQLVPMKEQGKTTPFSFTYTVTPDDQAAERSPSWRWPSLSRTGTRSWQTTS